MATAKKVKKVKKVTVKPEGPVSSNDINSAIATLEVEIEKIMSSDVKPRRRKIVEYRRDLMKIKSDCSCENLKRIPGSSKAQCQNTDCGRIHRLRG